MTATLSAPRGPCATLRLSPAGLPHRCRLQVPDLFLGTIIIPIVGNAAEHAAAIIFAAKNKMELSLVSLPEQSLPEPRPPSPTRARARGGGASS